ncbi:PTS system, lactose/cellobiose family IIC subunit [Coriobacterium glomerans PW2]|uniref:Permease IIC component n=2 Tax=Coriobacterium TaxID=33870 RepID=F2NB85_CORGP|nr:PTS system, lactose/cellobiose family IIC subunit [Coriobacterium glomerans PW2]
MGGITAYLERRVLPIANKMSTQRHLHAIRDAFISIVPITLFGGIATIIGSAPSPEGSTNPLLLGWSHFVESNSLLLTWANTMTLGAMSVYICIGVTYFLCKHYKTDAFIPIVLSMAGFLLICVGPDKLGWDVKTANILYLDGKGLLVGIFIAIFAVESYQWMRDRNVGRISLPPSVPVSLSEAFASLVPGLIILFVHTIVFGIFNMIDTILPAFIYTHLSPMFNATDSLAFSAMATLLVQFFWFFGIHDAALAGVLGPIRDGGLSINAAAHAAGQSLPNIFTTPFWVYFVAIGGCGSVLALAILLLRSKSKQLRTIGRVGLVPAVFNISEPIIFGVPLMMNPIFFIPFLLTSTVNAIVAYLCMMIGLVNKTFALLSWNMPGIIGAYLSTFDVKAILLVAALIIVDMVIYFPFFKAYERECLEQEGNDVKLEEG